LAQLLDCRLQDVLFTSGATEANNLALIGIWEASLSTASERNRILIGGTEHPSVLKVAEHLAKRGAEIVKVPVDRDGLHDLDQLATSIDRHTLVVSVMAANNETGVISPLGDIVEVAHRHGAFVHSDATQMVGRLPLSIRSLDLDLLSLSGHKMHGPKGVGALVASRHVPMVSAVHGGGQERGFRSGTLNTPGIVGLGIAATLARARLDEAPDIAARRDRFAVALKDSIRGVEVNGEGSRRLPNTVNVRFTGAEAMAVMASMPQVACSSGSACSSAVLSPSPTLLAMGLPQDAAAESIRFSLSRDTTDAELAQAVGIIAEAVAHVRQTMGIVIA
jgi:cysteine desulfurase